MIWIQVALVAALAIAWLIAERKARPAVRTSLGVVLLVAVWITGAGFAQVRVSYANAHARSTIAAIDDAVRRADLASLRHALDRYREGLSSGASDFEALQTLCEALDDPQRKESRREQ